MLNSSQMDDLPFPKRCSWYLSLHLEYPSSSRLPVHILLIFQHSAEMSFSSWSLIVFFCLKHSLLLFKFHTTCPYSFWHFLPYIYIYDGSLFTSYLTPQTVFFFFFLRKALRGSRELRALLVQCSLIWTWVQIPALSFLSELGWVIYLSEL